MWQAFLPPAGRRTQPRGHKALPPGRAAAGPAGQAGRLHLFRRGLCAYHDLAASRRRPWRLATPSWPSSSGHHRWGSEVNCRLDRCRRLARLGRLTARGHRRDAGGGGPAAPAPDQPLARLEAIERGETAMTIWDWIRDFEEQALEAGDAERIAADDDPFRGLRTPPDRPRPHAGPARRGPTPGAAPERAVVGGVLRPLDHRDATSTTRTTTAR